MMKEVIRTLETGFLSEIGLVAFLIVFVLILVRVMLMSKREVQEAKHLPLEDAEPVDSDSDPEHPRTPPR